MRMRQASSSASARAMQVSHGARSVWVEELDDAFGGTDLSIPKHLVG